MAGVKIVNADGEEVENASKAPKAEGSLTHEQGDLTVTVTNALGGRIPGVGGMGTTLYYVLGRLLTLAAGAVLLTKGRRKKKETA